MRTRVMGILNVTPDSFSDGGEFVGVERAVAHAVAMLDAGAQIIDVGGESTRPGSAMVDASVELARTIPVIEALRAARPDVVISIDTTKSAVADAAARAGATMINDISALRFDPAIAEVAAQHRCELVLMHMRGTPQTMRWSTAVDEAGPVYEDVVADVAAFLQARADVAIAAGVDAARIVVDPGIGFGKTRDQNLELLRRTAELTALGYPLLIGTSRKSFIGAVTGRGVGERLLGTAATVAYAVEHGAAIVRVHDVAEMVEVVQIVEAIVGAR